MDELASEYRLIAPNRRGYNISSNPPEVEVREVRVGRRPRPGTVWLLPSVMPVGTHDLQGRSSLELVEIAIASNHRFKGVVSELERRPSSEGAGARLIAAYRSGEAPAWLAACLLGRIGHPSGYEVVKQILLAGKGLLSESYAGPAMVELLGERAADDLLQIMRDGEYRRVREGAMYGLAGLGRCEDLPAVIAAVRARRVGHSAGSSLLAELGLSDGELLGLLRHEDERIGRMAAHHVHHLRATYPRPAPPPLEIQEAVLPLLPPGMREHVIEWFSEA